MKRHVLLSFVVAAVLFAVSSTSAHAGMFGRLGVFHRGCSPCEPAACQPCEAACQPCEVAACDPCEPACCGTVCHPRPFKNFIARLKAKCVVRKACCSPCEPACEPCEPVCCEPCEPVCDAGCDPCHRPFAGFFANLRAKFAARHCNACGPCEPACSPCEPICEPCKPACCEACK